VGQASAQARPVGGSVHQECNVEVAHRADAVLDSRAKQIDHAHTVKARENGGQFVLEHRGFHMFQRTTGQVNLQRDSVNAPRRRQ